MNRDHIQIVELATWIEVEPSVVEEYPNGTQIPTSKQLKALERKVTSAPYNFESCSMPAGLEKLLNIMAACVKPEIILDKEKA